MDRQPQDTPAPDEAQDETQDEAQDEETREPVGFWRRMFGGGAASPGEVDEVDDDDHGDDGDGDDDAQGHGRSVTPRKPQQSLFDKADDVQRKRYARAAMVRRERMARAIGDRVEKVIVDRMEDGEQKLERVAETFGDVRHLLGAIGHNLDTQGQDAARIAAILGQLPEASEREQEILSQIADNLQGQTVNARALAESVQEVPQMLALARQGQHEAGQRLEALREVKCELELQRDQRERLITVFRDSTRMFEERMGRLEETLVTQAAQARNDADALKRALQEGTQRMLERSAEDARREDERASRMRGGLEELGRQLRDQNLLAGAAVQNQGEALSFFKDSHGEMLDAVQRSQSRTLKEMKRIQEEVQERAESLAWRGRLTLVGAAGAIALTWALLFRGGSTPPAAPQAAAPSPVQQQQTAPDAGQAQTLPAGFKRVSSADGGR